MYEYTTITIDLTGQGGTGVSGTLYAELFHTVTLANNDTVPPRKYSATVTTGAGSLVLPCTATAIKGTNAPFLVTFIPTSGAEVTLGRIIPTESASAVQLSDLLEVGATSAVPVTTYNVGNTTLSIAPSRAALAAMGGLTDGDRVLVTAIGIYRYSAASTATADDATIITPANAVGRWLLEIPSVAGTPFITPEIFGAVGDGTTDDTTALQAAINASSDTGAPVMLGPNAYAFTRLVLKSGMSVVGAGQFASQLVCTDSATLDAGVSWGSALRRADDNGTVFYVRLENLAILSTLNGSGVAAAQATYANVIGLNLAGCGYSHIQNVAVQGFGQAGIVMARCENGTEGLGFTNTAQDGNYNSFFNVRPQGNGAHRTTAHTAHTVTGDTTSTSKTVANVSAADIAKLVVGQYLTGTGIPDLTQVETISASSFTMSIAATATNTGVQITQSRATTGLLIAHGNDNLVSGATFESQTRGVWFGVNAFGNQVAQPRAEGLLDAAWVSSPASGNPQTGSGNMVIGDYYSSTPLRRDVANNGEFRYIGGPTNGLRSGRLATTSLSANSDNHFLDVLGILTDSTGKTYVKSPGNSTGTAAPQHQLRNTIVAVTSGDTLAQYEVYCSDSSGGAAGVNGILRAKAFDSSGQTGWSILTGKGGAPTEAVEINENVSITKGDLIVSLVGKGLKVKEGTNAKMGRATLVAGAVTVATTAVTASSEIFVTSQVDGGTPGWLRVSARVAATSFTITSSSGADTSTVAWMIVEPA